MSLSSREEDESNKRKHQRLESEFRKDNAAGALAGVRANYRWRADNAISLHKHLKDAPPLPLRVRVRYWFGQLVPRRHWGIYTADGRRRICIWKTWLGRVTVEIDVKMG